MDTDYRKQLVKLLKHFNVPQTPDNINKFNVETFNKIFDKCINEVHIRCSCQEKALKQILKTISEIKNLH